MLRIRNIALRFWNSVAKNTQDENEVGPCTRDNIPLSEKIGNWLPDVEDSGELIQQPKVYDELDTNDRGEDKGDALEDDLFLELAVYC